MLLYVVGSCWAKFETSQIFEPTTLNVSFVSWSLKRSTTMLDPFAQLLLCATHAHYTWSPKSDGLSFPRCTAGTNIVGLVWIGSRLLVWKEEQHLTRTWLILKRTISRIPNKEAQKSHIPFENFCKSRFRASCKISFPDKKSCIFPNPASILVNSWIPKIHSRPCLDVGDWSQWVLTNGRCSDAFALPFIVPQGSCLEPCYYRHIFSRATYKIFSRLQTKPEHSA